MQRHLNVQSLSYFQLQQLIRIARNESLIYDVKLNDKKDVLQAKLEEADLKFCQCMHQFVYCHFTLTSANFLSNTSEADPIENITPNTYSDVILNATSDSVPAIHSESDTESNSTIKPDSNSTTTTTITTDSIAINDECKKSPYITSEQLYYYQSKILPMYAAYQKRQRIIQTISDAITRHVNACTHTYRLAMDNVTARYIRLGQKVKQSIANVKCAFNTIITDNVQSRVKSFNRSICPINVPLST